MIHGFVVCKKSWLAIYQVSDRRFRKLVQLELYGCYTIGSQTKRMRKTTTYISKACMESSFMKMSDKMPDSVKIHLPCYLNYRALHQFLIDHLKAVRDNSVFYSQFCKMMLTDFKHVSIPKIKASQEKYCEGILMILAYLAKILRTLFQSLKIHCKV